jgi:restriction endonuclease Mrr
LETTRPKQVRKLQAKLERLRELSGVEQKIVGRVADKRVLIDGETLANHMIDHSVGVSLQRSYEVKRVDSDYFSEA